MIAIDQQRVRPGMEGLSNEALLQVAGYFQALSEPTRLQILNLLRTPPSITGRVELTAPDTATSKAA